MLPELSYPSMQFVRNTMLSMGEVNRKAVGAIYPIITKADFSNVKKPVLIGAGVTLATCAAIVAPPLVLGAVGFGSGGVTGGSLAAIWQSSYGGYVASGSLFAICQSTGVIGILSATNATAIAVTTGVVAGGLKYFKKK